MDSFMTFVPLPVRVGRPYDCSFFISYSVIVVVLLKLWKGPFCAGEAVCPSRVSLVDGNVDSVGTNGRTSNPPHPRALSEHDIHTLHTP
jgi:hypothetical protein